jgi:hypothetical protein
MDDNAAAAPVDHPYGKARRYFADRARSIAGIGAKAGLGACAAEAVVSRGAWGKIRHAHLVSTVRS